MIILAHAMHVQVAQPPSRSMMRAHTWRYVRLIYLPNEIAERPRRGRESA